MSVFTSITTEDLTLFLAQYPLTMLRSFRGIAAGISNSSYFLDTEDRELVLTIVERESFEDVEWFMQLVDFLNQNGLPCASPVVNNDGTFTGTLANKPATLVERLIGEDKTEVSAADCKLIGQIVAQLHVTAMDFDSPRTDTRGAAWRSQVAEQIRSYLSEDERELLDTEMALQHDDILSALPQSVIHADLFRDNLLFNGNDISGLIDFYFACDGCMIYDLCIAYNDWCRNSDGSNDPKRADALLIGYNSIRKLQRNEEENWAVALRCAALRYWLSRLQDFHFPAQGELTFTKDPNTYKRILQHCILGT